MLSAEGSLSKNLQASTHAHGVMLSMAGQPGLEQVAVFLKQFMGV